jgi:hypothetical protein
MPNFQDNIRRRENASQRAHSSLMRVVKTLQRQAYVSLLEWLISADFETEAGNLKSTSKNIYKVRGVFTIFERFSKAFRKAVFGEIQKQTSQIATANQAYFEGMVNVPSTVQDLAREAVLLRLGYKDGALLPGSYFEKLFNQTETAQRVAGLVNQAIQAKMPLKDFRAAFKPVFVGTNDGTTGKKTPGMLEYRYKQMTFDLFNRVDRTINLEYADRLKFNYAVYSGTLIETSRPFCQARNNKVFSREEIEAWQELEFDGKPAVYEPFTDLGGHNCRHHLNFISDEIAKALRPDLA